MKVVINKCFGGYGLSVKAILEIGKRKGLVFYPYIRDYGKGEDMYVKCDENCREFYFVEFATEDNGPQVMLDDMKGRYDFGYPCFDDYYGDWSRTDPDVVAVVEELGEKADGSFSNLAVVNIPDGVRFTIEEYDGMETVEEVHRSWA